MPQNCQRYPWLSRDDPAALEGRPIPFPTYVSPEARAVPLGPKGRRTPEAEGCELHPRAIPASMLSDFESASKALHRRPLCLARCASGLQQCDKIRVLGPLFALTEWPRIDHRSDPDLGGWGAEEETGAVLI
jgi:hypothetical protein